MSRDLLDKLLISGALGVGMSISIGFMRSLKLNRMSNPFRMC